jgi:hypothetical protein
MENEPPTTQRPATQDPQQGQPATTMPTGIAAFLHVLRILLGYGRHLADTARDRATAPSFASVAACFGTARLPVILAHLQRGILRAVALERVLLARAARGRDIVVPPIRVRGPPQPTVPADPSAAQPAVITEAAQPALTRMPASRPAGSDDPTFHMPTLEELEARARRCPLGQTIIEICLDLAVVPGFCAGTFWNSLFELVTFYGGNLAALMRERSRREAAFMHEQDTAPRPGRTLTQGGTPTQPWAPAQAGAWWDATRETMRAALGFFIGEPPAMPLGLSPAHCVAAEAATRPP